MSFMLEIAIVFGAGFLAALVGSMSGGGVGIIQLAGLLAVGLPINSAVATNIFGDAGFYPPALRNFNRAGQLDQKTYRPIIAVNLLATIGGTLLIIKLDEEVLTKIVAASLIVVLVLTFKDRQGGLKTRPPKPSWPLAYFAARFSAAGGFGNNLLAVLALIHLRGLTALAAVANAFLANGLSSLLAIGLLLPTGLIDWRLGLTCFIANLIGSQIGSKIALKRGSGFVRKLIALVATAIVIQLLLF